MSGSRDWPGRPSVDPSVFIARGAVVVGDVTLGARSSVWFHAVLRGDTDRIEIGGETNVQDHTVIHADPGQPAIVGHRVTIGHRAVVHGCVVEDRCLIGMGAIVLNGARIGTGSLVAAGALVREGQVVPPGSLVVGAPARIAGPVRDAHREAIERGADHYAAMGRRYLAAGYGRPVTRARPALGEIEWNRILDVLAESPRWVRRRLAADGGARWLARPPGGGWSALEVVCHLRDAEREVYLPRLARILEEEVPDVADVDLRGWDEARGYRGEDPAAALSAWQSAREDLMRALRPLGPREWARVAIHSVHGGCSLGDMVRGWAEHDLSHRRQIAGALVEVG